MFRSRLPALSRLTRGAIACSRRQQATRTDDKKFHCSVCFKAFRLEMAAQLHIKQAHGGNGSVGAGPGPGMAAAPAAAAGAPGGAATKTAHMPTMGMGGAVQKPDDDVEEFRPIRRQRPTPQPLNKFVLEMPEDHMKAMLEVWDTIGAKRVPNFVASKVVAKVFAARPVSDEDAAPTYLSVSKAEGPNPFEQASAATGEPATAPAADGAGEATPTGVDAAPSSGEPTAESAVPAPSKAYDWCHYAVASASESASPFRSKAVPSPFLTAAQQALPGPQPRQAKPAATEQPEEVSMGDDTAVPDDMAAAPPPPTLDQGAEATSPFAAAGAAQTMAESPFAAAGQVAASPFAAAAGQAASPFAAAATADTAASPFAAASTAPSPFGAAAARGAPAGAPAGGQQVSPFLPPGAQVPVSSAANPFDAAGQQGSALPPGFQPFGQPEAEKLIKCPKCDREFKSQRALSDHALAKHDMQLPRGSPKEQKFVPTDLPPYVPSPVDFSQTVPYGNTKRDAVSSWAEVELFPTAAAVSNMELLGVVKAIARTEVSHAGEDGASAVTALRLVVAVDGDGTDQEDVPVRVFGDDLISFAERELSKGSTVAATGVLRLNPQYDKQTNRYLFEPALNVSAATGALHCVIP